MTEIRDLSASTVTGTNAVASAPLTPTGLPAGCVVCCCLSKSPHTEWPGTRVGDFVLCEERDSQQLRLWGQVVSVSSATEPRSHRACRLRVGPGLGLLSTPSLDVREAGPGVTMQRLAHSWRMKAELPGPSRPRLGTLHTVCPSGHSRFQAGPGSGLGTRIPLWSLEGAAQHLRSVSEVTRTPSGHTSISRTQSLGP